MVNNYTRRQAMKVGTGLATAAACGGLGYVAGGNLVDASSIEGLVNELHDASVDILNEVKGEAENRLKKGITEVRQYLGETVKEAEVLSDYWDRIGLLSRQNYSDLVECLEKAEGYIDEADFGERMTRLKDRLVNRGLDIEEKGKQYFPEWLKKANEAFSKMVKGEERGSNEALEGFRLRLDSLVDVYDVNKDSVIAQADLLQETGGYFSQAQDEVIKVARGYVADPKVSNNEKDFYRGLIEVSQRDKSGRRLADYLLNTESYYQSMGAIESLGELRTNLESTIGELQGLQGLMDEGLAIKEKLRGGEAPDIAKLVGQVETLSDKMEERKKHLEKMGYDIDYTLFPKITALRDRALDVVNEGKKMASYGGAIVGAAAGTYLHSFLTRWGDRASFKRTAEELEATKAELAEVKSKLHKPNGGD
jgi:hypothetical protein